jgi:L-ribulose-5-phosphate 4-epimerase
MMAWHTMMLNSQQQEGMQKILLDKHFLRKHGKDAYYGQT